MPKTPPQGFGRLRRGICALGHAINGSCAPGKMSFAFACFRGGTYDLSQVGALHGVRVCPFLDRLRTRSFFAAKFEFPEECAGFCDFFVFLVCKIMVPGLEASVGIVRRRETRAQCSFLYIVFACILSEPTYQS